jgi:hypothetical protein
LFSSSYFCPENLVVKTGQFGSLIFGLGGAVRFWEGGGGEGTGEVRGTEQLFTIFTMFVIFTLLYPEGDLNLPFGGSFSCYISWFWYPSAFISTTALLSSGYYLVSNGGICVDECRHKTKIHIRTLAT